MARFPFCMSDESFLSTVTQNFRLIQIDAREDALSFRGATWRVRRGLAFKSARFQLNSIQQMMEPSILEFKASPELAGEMDTLDPLKGLREHFFIPKDADGSDLIYFTGNSLGLQPKTVR